MTQQKTKFCPSGRQLLAALTLTALGCSAMLDSVQAGEKPSTEEVNTTGLAVTDDTVRVGILHSLTGTMAISETGSVQAEQLAIKQINEQGGVLGRQIEYIVEDGASDWPTFAEKARKLLEEDDVASVFGAWTSASRKAVLPVFEQNNGLLYYPTFYEGLEQSENVIYTGQEATQQILAALDWVAETHGAETFYLVGSDYIWPRTSMKIARTHIERDLGGEVVGEDYYPLGNTQFGSLINKIKLRKPDLVFAAVVGGSNVAWFKQLNAAGMTPERMPMLTISVTEDEVLGIGKQNVAGFWSSMKYFQSLDIPANNDFVAAFRAEYGEDAVIGDVTESAYLGPWLWKRAVEKAGSFDVSRVTAASAGLEWQEGLPHGYTRLMPNHHLSMRTRIGEWQPDGQARVIFESEIIEPNPFPEGY